ncbi:HAD family phosphatase [Actinacidiphila glaucinigra]|uniref:HAD family hydrolase n=1 Tax=Actinacidiphila glaucinigra TaxID=235986 RepID=UPI00340DF795
MVPPRSGFDTAAYTVSVDAVPWVRVCAAFAARHGHPWRAEDTAALHGNGRWTAYVAGLCGGAADPAEVVEASATAATGEVAAGRVPAALPGAVDLVLEAPRHGPVGLATASPRRFVLAVLDGLGLSGRLSDVVCGEDVARAKPAPDPYVRAAAEIGVPPSRRLAVEDAPNGIRSATAALPLLTRLLAPHPGPLVPEGTV